LSSTIKALWSTRAGRILLPVRRTQSSMPTDPLIFAVTARPLNGSNVEALNKDLIEQMGAERFTGPNDNQALELIVKDEYWYLPDDLPKANTVIQAHPATPYYGPDYARGYWPEIATITEYLRHRITDSSVWYGPDSSDEVEQVTPEWLTRMWKYWAVNGSRAYYTTRSGDMPP
jgi:hypothetical protein